MTDGPQHRRLEPGHHAEEPDDAPAWPASATAGRAGAAAAGPPPARTPRSRPRPRAGGVSPAPRKSSATTTVWPAIVAQHEAGEQRPPIGRQHLRTPQQRSTARRWPAGATGASVAGGPQLGGLDAPDDVAPGGPVVAGRPRARTRPRMSISWPAARADSTAPARPRAHRSKWCPSARTSACIAPPSALGIGDQGGPAGPRPATGRSDAEPRPAPTAPRPAAPPPRRAATDGARPARPRRAQPAATTGTGRRPATRPSAAGDGQAPPPDVARGRLEARRRRGRRPSHPHQVAELGQLGVADAADLGQVVDRAERPVALAVVDDGRRRGRTDAGQRLELVGGGRVEVDRARADSSPRRPNRRPSRPPSDRGREDRPRPGAAPRPARRRPAATARFTRSTSASGVKPPAWAIRSPTRAPAARW